MVGKHEIWCKDYNVERPQRGAPNKLLKSLINWSAAHGRSWPVGLGELSGAVEEQGATHMSDYPKLSAV